MSSHVTTALALGLALAMAAPAHAQDTMRARQLFELGVAAMDRGSPAEAAGYFNQSYQIYPRASTACNMATAQERLGRPCDAIAWYRQCAALDDAGSAREHANRQVATLSRQCPAPPVHDPFVRTPTAQPAPGAVSVVEVGTGRPTGYPSRQPDHTLLGVGIGALVLGGGALVGGVLSALEAQSQAAYLPPEGGPLPYGSEDADTYYRAATFSDLALGLYIGGGLIAGLGVVLVIVDLLQPGVFGGSAAAPNDLSLALAPTPGGAYAQLGLDF